MNDKRFPNGEMVPILGFRRSAMVAASTEIEALIQEALFEDADPAYTPFAGYPPVPANALHDPRDFSFPNQLGENITGFRRTRMRPDAGDGLDNIITLDFFGLPIVATVSGVGQNGGFSATADGGIVVAVTGSGQAGGCAVTATAGTGIPPVVAPTPVAVSDAGGGKGKGKRPRGRGLPVWSAEWAVPWQPPVLEPEQAPPPPITGTAFCAGRPGGCSVVATLSYSAIGRLVIVRSGDMRAAGFNDTRRRADERDLLDLLKIDAA